MINSSTRSPLPVMKSRLQWLRSCGVDAMTVLDAGVQYGTPFLQEVWPEACHLLFEPIDQYYPSIKRAYSNQKWELFPVALSDTDGQSWQLGISADKSGKVTESRLSDTPCELTEIPNLISCSKVARVRLDSVMADRQDPQPYLLKLDVDGHEISVLNGAVETMAKCSIVIVEAAIHTIGAKIAILEGAGFDLVDIVDLCYYYQHMSQVDLIFVHRAWVAKCPDLRPWQTKQFEWEAWVNLSRNIQLKSD